MQKLSALLLAILAGCAPMTASSLRDQGARQTFEVAGDYQSNYRILLDEMRRCMQGGMVTASVIVHGELYSDVRQGVITPTMHGGLGAEVLLIVDVSGDASASTRVTVTSKSDPAKDAAALQAVFNGTPLCRK